MKPRFAAWKNFLLLLGVTAMMLGVAEGLFRAYEKHFLIPALPPIEGSEPVNLAALRYNDGLVKRKTDEGEFRILSFGDSFAYSIVEPQFSYAGILEARLNDARLDHQYTVVNLGEPATGTRHFLAAYNYWSQIFEHDAVLFHLFLGNDILDDAYLHGSLEWSPNDAIFTSDNPVLKAGNPRIPRKYPSRMLDFAYAWWMSAQNRSKDTLPRGYNWAGISSFEPELFDRINFKFMENFDPGKLDRLLAGYDQVRLLLARAQEISGTGRAVAIILGPAQPQVDERIRAAALQAHDASAANYDMHLAQRIIGRLAQKIAPDVPIIDLSDAFREHHLVTGEALYFRRNTHWDLNGNRLAGELIAERLLTEWFGHHPQEPDLNAETPRVSAAPVSDFVPEEQLDLYLEPLLGRGQVGSPVITGAFRAVQMIDGIIDNENFAVVPLNQAAKITFPEPRVLGCLKLKLYDADQRQYRFMVELQRAGQWVTVANQSREAVGGLVEIQPGKHPVSGLRITGFYNSAQEHDPGNAFLHIQEVSWCDDKTEFD